jgi:hypothetical protein
MNTSVNPVLEVLNHRACEATFTSVDPFESFRIEIADVGEECDLVGIHNLW